jgi:hypothetical protein
MTTQEKIDALKHTLTTRGWIDVIRPALIAAINTAEQQWLTGARPTAEANVTDEALKGRVIAFRWLLGQERQMAGLVAQLEAVEKLAAETEPAIEGGSPYV